MTATPDAKPGLKARLIAAIDRDGPMTVAAYMAACLHDPEGGYYANGAGLGEDFITAPETSQVFGELLGLWAAHEWQVLGAPEAFHLVEMGPGRGTLMQDVLRAGDTVPGFSDAFSLTLVEASPVLAKAQEKALKHATPRHVVDLGDVPDGPTLLLANELLDCLPVRQFVRQDQTWHERVVGLRGDELAFGLSDPVELPATVIAHGNEAEIQTGLDVIVMMLAQRFTAQPGRALFIDYGPADHAPGDSLRSFGDSAQTDPLEAPGQHDLTVDVDFSRLATLARKAGLDVAGPVQQGPFLMALGAQQRLDQLVKSAPDQADDLFASVARLIDPNEMGERFKVICLSSPGLPRPAGFAIAGVSE